MSVQMELSRIIISEMSDKQIIVLKEVSGERNFPIVIGSNEAVAIDRRLKGKTSPRPLTHDLLANTIDALGATLGQRVENLGEGRPSGSQPLEQATQQVRTPGRHGHRTLGITFPVLRAPAGDEQ